MPVDRSWGPVEKEVQNGRPKKNSNLPEGTVSDHARSRFQAQKKRVLDSDPPSEKNGTIDDGFTEKTSKTLGQNDRQTDKEN